MRIFIGCLAVLVVAFVSPSTEAAQHTTARVYAVETKSLVPVFIGGFIDCQTHIPYEGTAFVQHGKVNMKRFVVPQCGNKTEPATGYWYVSDPGYKGDDEVNFSHTSGSAMIVHITVR